MHFLMSQRLSFSHLLKLLARNSFPEVSGTVGLLCFNNHWRKFHHKKANENVLHVPDQHLQTTHWSEEATLYVHWPYCQRRCTYCNFNKYISSNVDNDKMQQCLVREAKTLIQESGVKRIKSVFFGGGTPSLAQPKTLSAILEAVSGVVSLPNDAEVSMEGNPTSVGRIKLLEFKLAGINRVSLGVQALNDKDLQLLGRDHTSDESRKCIEEARRLFPGRVSIDVIFGRPGQRLSTWEKELQEVTQICDNHVSLYQLTLERGTALFKMYEVGAVDFPSEDVTADMYELAVEIMTNERLNRYEVSSFAREGFESLHNQSYWDGGQYIGIGPGAHGRFILRNPTAKPIPSVKIQGHDNWNPNQLNLQPVQVNREARIQTLEPEPWMREVLKYGHGTRKRVIQSQLDVLQEYLMVGLRTSKGVTNHRWGQFCDVTSLREVFDGDAVDDFMKEGLIVMDQFGLRATVKGMSLLDSILPHLLIKLQNWFKTVKAD
ncbi:radical S-adenosyl methionine domain-containing protein 1, mitochondrial-like [Asterias amurensis]|uniref:radical S-adenosyl methionine domain-containing protein 1, mitochondrial-like n=1 Tax=Asterias amurensis TaxID=7602 RepID=UPI003AB1C1DB